MSPADRRLDDAENFLPTSGFTMLGDPEAAACEGDVCVVPGTDR